MSYISKKYLKLLERKSAQGNAAAKERLQKLMAMPEEKRQEEAWYYCSDMLIKRAMNREEFLNFYQLRSGESTGEEKLEERKAIAEYLGLSIHQLKYRSEELQEAGLLKWKLKGKGRNRRWILVGYGSEIKAYLSFHPKKPRKPTWACPF